MLAMRVDKDTLGPVELPADALYGSNAARAAKNFDISGRRLGGVPALVTGFAWLKAAAAHANGELGELDGKTSHAIREAALEMSEGLLNEHLIVDMFEGSGGTSLNMNINEVLANRALQNLGLPLARYDRVHPNDHVNRGQSTNDVVPSAIKLGAWLMLGELAVELDALAVSFRRQAADTLAMLRLGRTCFQDAQPMTLGQALGAHAALVERLSQQLRARRDEMRVLPIGATAIGTGFGAAPGYRPRVFSALRQISGIEFVPAPDMFDALANGDVFSRLSGELRNCGVSLGKIANDFILLASGPMGGVGELVLPSLQPGSSIMPGKVNPVLPMAICQLGFTLAGYDAIVAAAVQQGQFEINPYEPVIAHHLFEGLKIAINGVRLFRSLCVDGLQPQADRMEEHLLHSTAIATALLPVIGYDRASNLVRRSLDEGRSLAALAQDEGLLDAGELTELLYRAAGFPSEPPGPASRLDPSAA